MSQTEHPNNTLSLLRSVHFSYIIYKSFTTEKEERKKIVVVVVVAILSGPFKNL